MKIVNPAKRTATTRNGDGSRVGKPLRAARSVSQRPDTVRWRFQRRRISPVHTPAGGQDGSTDSFGTW